MIGPRAARRWILPLILLELLACLGDLLLGPFGRVHWEERFNARAGVQLACGHWEALFDLQYVSFCGGCTGEALMAAPLFQALGPTVLAWKLVPLAFHAVVLACGSFLATRAAGPRAGAAFVAMIAAAPGFYRELVLTGWGNHVESAAFPLAAASLLVIAAGRGAVARGALVTLAGGLAGLGAWFCHTSVWALPALGLGALWVAPLATPLFLGAAWLGFQPYGLYFDARPDQAARTSSWAVNLHPAPFRAWVDWLWGDYLRWGLWDPADHGDGTAARGAWWFGLWGLGLVGLVGAVRRRRWGSRAARMARLFAPVGLAALLVAYALRYDLWSHLPEVPSQPTLGLRYRAPLVPLLSFGVALAVGWRRAATAGLALLVAFGLVRRAALWDTVHGELPGLGVYAHDGWRDRSVPLGQPPQRLARAQGRPQDIEAGLAFVEGHTDPFPDCSRDHLFEVGRRLGLALAAGRDPGADALTRALEAADSVVSKRILGDGVAAVLVDPEGVDLARAVAATAALPDPWPTLVGDALGRRVAAHVPDPESGVVQSGVCFARGRASVLDGSGTPEPCAEGVSWLMGRGYGWAAARGCSEADLAALTHGQRADLTVAAAQGWTLGCAALRPDRDTRGNPYGAQR